MALPIWQRTITTEAGDVIPGAEVEVVLESTGLAADIFSNRDGSTPLTNPFFTGANGFAQFYAAPGEYRITATGPTGSIVWRWNVLTGDAALRTTGTAAGEVPTNGDLGSAAFVDTGTAAGEVPTNADLGTMSTQDANAVSITGGNVSVANLTTSNDADVNGLKIGRGAGNLIENTALGFSALANNTTGTTNTAVGRTALANNTTGSQSTAVGRTALRDNTTGQQNTAVGLAALESNTTGTANTAVGRTALTRNTTGGSNTSLGRDSLSNNTTGGGNTAVGILSLFDVSTGSNNIGVGFDSGRSNSPFLVTTQSNRIVMGNNNHTDAYIRIAWTVTSDARDKAEIAPIPLGLDFVNQLNPTEYQFKAGGRDGDPDGRRRYGFLAQDVLAAEGDNPVIADAEDPENLKLHESYLVPVLVNAIKELTARIEELEQKS